MAFSASAQTWNGGGANDNWSTGGVGGNWSGAAAPVSATTTSLTFAGITRLTPNNDLANPFTLNTLTFAAGAGAFNLGGNSLFFDGATRSITSNTSSNVIISQNVTFGGNGSINATSTGGITFAGNTAINVGTVNVSNNVTMGNLTVGNGGLAVLLNTGVNTLTLNGTVTYDGGAANTGDSAELRGQIDLNGGVRSFTAINPGAQPAYDLIVTAKLIGTGGSGLNVPTSSLGNILFTAQNTYSGPTTFNNNLGAVYLGVDNALPTTSAVTLGTTAFLSLRTPIDQGSIVAGDFNHQFASLSSSASDAEVRFGDTKTLTVGNGTNATYAGTFTQSTSTGAPTLIKTGIGRWTLSGNSSADPGGSGAAFQGSVIVNQGTLAITTPVSGLNSGTGRGTVLVNSGGTLAGNGALIPNLGSQAANTITIAAGGTIAPDAIAGPIGTLRLGANSSRSTVTINGTYLVDLTAVSSDRLTINGSLTLGGTSSLNASGIASVPGGSTILSYIIASFDNNSLTGTFASVSIPAGSSVQYNASNITLLVPVPEPGTVLGLAAGLLTCGAWIRRRMTRV